MKSTREQIYAAVFALVKNTPGLAVASRVWRAPDELSDSQFPALFADEGTENKEFTQQRGFGPRYTLHVDITVYVANPAVSDTPIGQETSLPSTAMNNFLDAIEVAFQIPPGQERLTLGGLVEHCQISGKTDRVSAVPGNGLQVSMAVVPVQITTY